MEVRDLARVYLPWAIAIPLAGVWSFQLDGIFIGATRTREMRNGMVLALAVYLAAGYALLDLWGQRRPVAGALRLPDSPGGDPAFLAAAHRRVLRNGRKTVLKLP